MSIVQKVVRPARAAQRRDWVAAYDAPGVERVTWPATTSTGSGTAACFSCLGGRTTAWWRYQRAYQAHVAAGQPLSAVRSRVSRWHCSSSHCDTGGRRWLGGARCAAPGGGEAGDVVERGYLLVRDRTHRHITSAEWESALEV